MITCEYREVTIALKIVMIAALGVSCGCRSAIPQNARLDSKVTRYSESGAEFFAEGDNVGSIKAFRKAIYRSWATDNPYHSGTNAYNLAAVLFDSGDRQAALDWLVDARVELARASESAGNTYLLEAKIAQQEGRLDDAQRLISFANCSPPPCGDTDPCLTEACQEPWLARLPCVGVTFAEKNTSQQCRDDYRAQVHLAKARLATEQIELSVAKEHLAHAIALAKDVCSYQLRAEIHHAAAMLDMVNGHYLESASHLDREARLLRQAGNYRKIPEVLMLAAATYHQTERFDLAADRLCRASRIWVARGDLVQAWDVLQQALATGEAEISSSTNVRLRLTALEIEAAATRENGPALPDSENPRTEAPLQEQGMLSSTVKRRPSRF